MRKAHLVPFLLLLLGLGLVVRSVFTLITLLFEDGRRDAITREELEGNRNGDWRIPKIIHQTYANESVPGRWKAAQKSCKDMHPEWEYKFWTDASARAFITKEYPDFLEIYDTYPYAIQRSDALRYFLLVHYGGVYIDLDEICTHKLTPLLHYPAWLRRTLPTGVSNDIMASIPNHPFFIEVTDRLSGFARQWGVKYITVMYSTGPLFLSVIWKEWMHKGRSLGEPGRVRVLMDGTSGRFFEHVLGKSSWHSSDAGAFLWAGDHWVFLTVVGVVGGVVVVAGLVKLYNRFVGALLGPQPWQGYYALPNRGVLERRNSISTSAESLNEKGREKNLWVRMWRRILPMPAEKEWQVVEHGDEHPA